jgi:sec-independent protein translocase protein TatB
VFNIGPMELLILAIVGLIVLGPDRLPGLARDAGRMLRTLREMATGARSQLRDELGPEFADVDLRNLNPRTALQRAILGDDDEVRSMNPRRSIREVFDEDDDDEPVSMQKPTRPVSPAQQPLGRGEQAPYDTDAT